MATKEVTPVAQAKAWEIRDAVWSPDSRWIAYSQEEPKGMDKVYLYSLEQDKTFDVTDGWYGSHARRSAATASICSSSPNRDFNPIYSATEWNHAYRDMARIYLVTLAKETPSPFKPRSDEAGEARRPRPRKPKKDAPIKVDIDGLQGSRAGAADPGGATTATCVGGQHPLLHPPGQQGRQARSTPVDMLESKAGPKIMEINSSPGFEGLEKATRKDIAGTMIDHAVAYAEAQRAGFSKRRMI